MEIINVFTDAISGLASSSGIANLNWQSVVMILISFLFMSLLFEGALQLMFSTLIQSIFIPVVISFVAIVLRVMSSNYTNLNKILCKYWPIIKIGNIVSFDSFYFILIWSILLLILYFCIYSIKDLK